MRFSMVTHSSSVGLPKAEQPKASGRRRKPAERQDRGTTGDGNSWRRTSSGSLAPYPSIGWIILTGETSCFEWKDPPPDPTGYRIPRPPPKDRLKGINARADGQFLSFDHLNRHSEDRSTVLVSAASPTEEHCPMVLVFPVFKRQNLARFAPSLWLAPISFKKVVDISRDARGSPSSRRKKTVGNQRSFRVAGTLPAS
jgi:hypothetical protein